MVGVCLCRGGNDNTKELLDKLAALKGDTEDMYLSIFRKFDYSRDFEKLIEIAGNDSIDLDQRLNALVVMAPLAEVHNSKQHFQSVSHLLDTGKDTENISDQAIFVSFVLGFLIEKDREIRKLTHRLYR